MNGGSDHPKTRVRKILTKWKNALCEFFALLRFLPPRRTFTILILFALVFGVGFPRFASAEISQAINYQGRLMTVSGDSVADGSYGIKFTIYDSAAGGTQLWSASTTNGLANGPPVSLAVDVQDGLFSILLGNASEGQMQFPENIFTNGDLYLGITIEADSEMTPRKRLSSVPYAYNSQMLQGQQASSSITNTGGDLFALHQGSTDAAAATRTALYVETKGTSNQYDFLMRLSDGTSDVFTINHQGNVTTTGSISIADALSIGGIRLDAIGVSPTSSGASLVGTFDEFIYSTSTNVQDVLDDFDLAIDTVSGTALGMTLHDVALNGNTTTRDLQFAGGTSTADFYINGTLTATSVTTSLLNYSFASGTSLSLNDQVYFGTGSDVDTNLFTVDTGEGADNLRLYLNTNYYGFNTAIWENPDPGELFGTGVQNQTGSVEQVYLTGARTSDVMMNYFSDSDGFNTGTGLRGWFAGRVGASSTFDFSFLNTDTGDGSPAVGTTLLLSLDGFNQRVDVNGDLDVSGVTTSTNLAVSGFVNSDLLPNVTQRFRLGNDLYKWLGLIASHVSSTNLDATGYVSTSKLYVNGLEIQGSNKFQGSQAAALSFTSTQNGIWRNMTFNASIKETNYNHTDGQATTTIMATGTYRISGYITFDLIVDSGAERSATVGRVIKNGTTLVTDEFYTYNRQLTVGEGTISIGPVLVNFDAGDEVVVQARKIVGASTVQSINAGLLIELVTGSEASGNLAPTLQQVTDSGKTTTNNIQFAGATSTGDIMPGTNLAYDLGSTDYRWDDAWVATAHVGTSTWDLSQAANGAFTIGQNGGSEAMRILTNGNVAIGTTTADYKFAVDGNARFDGGLYFQGGTSTASIMPDVDSQFYLGSATQRWLGLNVVAVSTTMLSINGAAVTTTVPTLDQVLQMGSMTTSSIQFGGGTSTGSLLPGTSAAYDLGSSLYRWNKLWLESQGIDIGTDADNYQITYDTTADELIFNDSGASKNFRIEGDSATSLFYVDAVNDRIGFGTSTPEYSYTFNGDLSVLNNASYDYGDGSDGAYVVPGLNTVINDATYLVGNETTADAVITVNDASAFSPGDEILIVQMQNGGGSGTAGRFEFADIQSILGNAITLTGNPSNNYYSGNFDQVNADATQVIRVPQYTDVTIGTGMSIVANAWDGYTGGYVVFRANGTVTFTGTGEINTDAKGFRGGSCNACGDGDWGDQGESISGLGTGVLTNNENGGGGGYGPSGSNGEPGAGGGCGSAGDDGISTYTATGGAAACSADLLVLGGGAGGGGDNDNQVPFPEYVDGAGSIYIVAKQIAGANISAAGENGIAPGGAGGTTGGGAGGTVIVRAGTATINSVSVAGGAGGVDSDDTGGDGGSGVTSINQIGQVSLFVDSEGGGGVGIGTNDTHDYRLYIEGGTAYCSSANCWADASDISLKKDIRDIDYGLADVMKLSAKRYEYIATEQSSFGFIAQEIEKIIPEVVTGKDGQKGISYGNLTPILVKAIQEQQLQIEQLGSWDELANLITMGTTSTLVSVPGGMVLGTATSSDARLTVNDGDGAVAAFNREGSDGVVVSIQQDGQEEGSITVTGSTVSYNAFTGSHYAWTEEEIEQGMLVRLTGDNKHLRDDPESELLYGIELTSSTNDARIMGSYLGIQDEKRDRDLNNPHLVMAVGNGEVWVADKGENLNIGDYLISSDMPGHAQKDTGEFVISNVFARVAEAVDWNHVTTSVDGVKHKKVSVFFESFERNNMQGSSVALQGEGAIFDETSSLFVGNAVFEGNITVQHHVAFNKDTVGQALMQVGDTRIRVKFVQEYGTLPIVTLTPASKVEVPYWVENASTQGFDIVIDEVQFADLLFNWHAFGNDSGRVYVSNGTTLEIELNDVGSTDLQVDLQADGEVFVPGQGQDPAIRFAPAGQAVGGQEVETSGGEDEGLTMKDEGAGGDDAAVQDEEVVQNDEVIVEEDIQDEGEGQDPAIRFAPAGQAVGGQEVETSEVGSQEVINDTATSTES